MESDFNPTDDTGLVLYDIAPAPPYAKHNAAPNPWKARYTLNFKGLPYTTHWVQMGEISAVRQALGVPACRKFFDGTEYYTLPVVTDGSTGAKVGDSFDIAVYLQKQHPEAGAGNLFPEGVDLNYECSAGMVGFGVPLSEENSREPTAAYARFNTNVDMVFSIHAQLMAEGMKWAPEREAAIKAEFARRAGKATWEELVGLDAAGREKLRASLKEMVKDLAALFQKEASGPFLLGTQPCYGDIIVGGWLRMMSRTLPGEEWEEIQGWYDGVFGKLHAALDERFGDVKE
ncbi:hypothetical protein B0J18DRAFT_145961 [Chaetomium sp. MPI-SDFR-AT-0129]|nr:hypothetical protein B0J18DRAFT_145961 [Chaetomium sp. MPI-SDFR-AT-0129]